jgi:hypothetical protein
MMRVRLLPEAENELLEAAEWYREQSFGLDYEFMRCMDEAMQRIVSEELRSCFQLFTRVNAEFWQKDFHIQ